MAANAIAAMEQRSKADVFIPPPGFPVRTPAHAVLGNPSLIARELSMSLNSMELPFISTYQDQKTGFWHTSGSRGFAFLTATRWCSKDNEEVTRDDPVPASCVSNRVSDSSPGGGYECILTDGQTELYCSEATDGNVPAATIHGSLFEA